MKITVIGLGSMGKRRIRLIKEVCPDAVITGVDSSEERRKEAEELFGINTEKDLSAALEKGADCAFVSTGPLSHAAIINQCLKNKVNVFTELNLVADGYEENIKLAKENNTVLFLSSTFLYRDEPKKIIEMAGKAASPVNYIYHIGQYLPDWHPWESYNNYFIGDKRTNGCREIFSIEMPWLITAFGEISEISAVKSKNTALNINYDDNFLVSIVHKNGTKGLLAVDVVSRKAVRKFEAFGEDLYVTWNGTPDSLVCYNIEKKCDETVSFEKNEHRENYAAFVTENPYREEIKAFFEKIKDRGEYVPWDFEKDREMLKLLDEIGA